MVNKIIMHVDMDAFYASIEQADNPHYRGKPVMVVMGPRIGIVSTSSYEARKFGVKTGMPVTEAYRLCPHGIFVTARLGRYLSISREIFKIYQDYSPLVEYYSVDEAFIDLTGCERLLGAAPHLANKIKTEIYSRFGITCSIGIASNKLLAKMAGELQKPDGLTVLADADIPKYIWPLPSKDLFYVGRKTAAKLKNWGINTIGDIARANPLFLEKKFGVIGKLLYEYAHGWDVSNVLSLLPDAKGCGHSRTLEYNVGDRQEIKRHLQELSRMISKRLRDASQKGKTITLSVRYHDFDTRMRKAATIKIYTDLESVIYKTSYKIFNELWNGEEVRKLGIKVSNLITCDSYEQLTLFDELPQKLEKVAHVQDRLEEKFGKKVLTPASLLNWETRRPFAADTSQQIRKGVL